MARYSSQTVTDEGTPGIPLAGTLVSVMASTGQLATLTDDNGYALQNPITIGSLGVLEFNIPDPGDECLLQYRYGGRLLREDAALIGQPAAFVGSTGPADNTYTSYTALQASDPTRKVARLVGDTDSTPHPDGNYSNPTQTTGAWVAQSAAGITFNYNDVGSLTRAALMKLVSLPRAPEDYGSIADAINAAKAVNLHATVRLAQGTTYTPTTTTTIDTQYVSLEGDATIDARGLPSGTTGMRIDCSAASSFGASYGYKGIHKGYRIAGAFSGQTFKVGIGVDYNGSTAYGAAQALSIGVRIAGWQYGVQRSNRAYNSVSLYGEIFNCDTIEFWPSGGGDNGERNTAYGRTLYNSRRGIVIQEPNGAYVENGGSIDYTQSVAKCDTGGRIMLTDMHMESSVWGTDSAEPYTFYAAGNGTDIYVRGGGLFSTTSIIPQQYLCFADVGASITFDGTFIHNINLTRQGTPGLPQATAFFNGPGHYRIINSHGYDGGILPDRLSPNRTSLVDPDFEYTDYPDLVWVSQDTQAITSRLVGTNMVIDKSTTAPRSGTQSLRLTKANGSGSAAAAGIIRLKLQARDKIFAGFQYRTDPGNAGADTNARRLAVNCYWAKFDRFDANGLPIWSRKLIIGASEQIGATALYQLYAFSRGLDARTAPEWATDFYIEIDLLNAATTGFLFDGAWVDAFS